MSDKGALSGPGPQAGCLSWRRLLAFDLLLLALLVLSTRLATFLHEGMGHSLSALALGGRVNGIRLTLFGGGNAYYRFDTELGPPGALLVAFAGILVNLLSGILALRPSRSSETGSSRDLFLSLFGMVSLLGALSYACLGSYYRVGDPAAWTNRFPASGEWLWVLTLASAPFAAYLGVNRFWARLRPWFPVQGFCSRAAVLALTLGIAGCAYAGLYLWADQRSTAIDTPKLAYLQAQERVRKEKQEALARQLQAAHPDWGEEELRRQIARTPVRVRPDEVPRRFPLMPVLALAQIAGALVALRKGEAGSILSVTLIRPGPILFYLGLATAVLGALIWWGGWIWSRG